MTVRRDVLMIEVDEGTDQLAGRLGELALPVRREGRLLVVPLESDRTYDVIMGAVAELDLPLHRLDQRRHRVAELFTEKETTSVVS
jgi:ABC-2 type transport system ATP-binding protein